MKKGGVVILLVAFFAANFPLTALADDESNRTILKQGLLGAGVGAISSGASGGNAGKGALIGAGANVIGGALLDTLTGPSQPKPQQQVVYVQQAPPVTYQQQAPVVYQQPVAVEPQPVYVQQPVAYAQPAQEDPNKKILKQGLLGAGVGAISASASGGSAGKGALIGAGTNVIGGALLDTLTGPSQSQPQPQQVVYVQQPAPVARPAINQAASSTQPKKKIIRKYDSDGKVVSEEEVWE